MRATIGLFLLTLSSHLWGQEPTSPAGWTATAPLAEARHSSCAARLSDGRILIGGGTGAAGDLSSAELYLPEGSFIPAARLNSARSHHTCTLLNDGRVLVAGGDAEGTGSAEVYDPKEGSWQLVAGSGQARSGHTATLLGDGRVLVAGGSSPDGPLDSLEIFDPRTNSLTRADAALTARDQHAAVLLGDGRVLIVGGRGAQGPLASTEIFDPADSSLTAGPSLTSTRAGHSATALDDGRVLVAGGSDGDKELDSAEFFDPAAGQFQLLDAKLQTARRDHLALLIPGNGGVLIAGGILKDQVLAATELFLPIENTFVTLGSLTAARSGLAGAAVDAGVILAAGGLNENGPQSACGVLLVPAIQFSKTLYHPQETAQVSGSNFRPNTTITFSLDFLGGSQTTGANNRLLTSSVTTPGGGTFVIFVGFSAVPIVLTNAPDAGKSARVTARTAGGITAVAAVPVKIATSLALTLPQPEYEGFDATFLTQLTRAFNPVPITGTLQLTVSTSPIIDAISNTILNPDASTQTLNSTSTSIFLSHAVSNLPSVRLNVVAGYSGDIAHEAATATATYTAVSKSPLVQLLISPAAPQVGVPFTLTAKATAQAAVPVHSLTGTLSFFQSGFLIGTDAGKTVPNGQPNLAVDRQFTALTLDPLSLSATYDGDSFFRRAFSSAVNVSVQKATPTLSFNNPPATYQCNQPSNFTTTLTFPPALGLANRTVAFQAFFNDGSVRSLSPLAQGNLVPSATNLGTATATFSTTLPVDTASFNASFSGDALLAPVSTAQSRVTLQLSPTTVQLVNTPSTVTSPATLTARVTSTQCGAIPTGTIEFLDGTASLAVVPVRATSVFSSGLPPASADALLTVSRPVGLHNISVKYSGDSRYLPATGAAVPIVFQ